MTRSERLGEFEQLVLLAVARLGDEGYGTTIRRELERRASRAVTVGALYATLERLEVKGLVRTREGEPTARRGGRAKRHYALTPPGIAALHDARSALDRMWEGLELPARGRRT